MVAKKPSRHKDDLAQLTAIFPGLGDLAGRLAPRSLQEYREDAKLYLTYCAWDQARALDPHTLRAWRQHLVEHSRISPNTINRRLKSLKTLVRASAACGAVDRALAYDFGLVELVSNSALRTRLTPPHHRYTPQQVRALCQAPDASTLVGLRDRALLATLASSGCRLSEVVSLQRGHIVAFATGWALQVLGKGQAEPRLAPLSKEGYTWVELWLTARDRLLPSPWIFTTLTGTPLTTNAARVRVKHWGRRSGLPQFRPHDFRRFVGTRVSEKFGIRQAQKVLGHKSLANTERYILDTMAADVTEGLY